MTERKIVVAGGSGLIGSNLVKRLHALGRDVTGTYYSRPPDFLEHLYVRADFTEYEQCLSITKGAQELILSAAQGSGIRGMKENPTSAFVSNLQMSLYLLEAARVNGVDKVVYISTSTVYQESRDDSASRRRHLPAPWVPTVPRGGQVLQTATPAQRAGHQLLWNAPIREDDLDLNQPPCDVYGVVGNAARYLEAMCRFYAARYGMKIGIVRPPSLYGHHDRFDAAAHVLPSLMRRAVDKQSPFTVWGDGSEVRDFLFVEDFIDDLLKVLDQYCVCDPLNVGCGEGITIREVAIMVLDVAGHRVDPRFDVNQPTSIHYRVLDNAKFHSIFGKPGRTPLRQGLEKTIEWYRSRLLVSPLRNPL